VPGLNGIEVGELSGHNGVAIESLGIDISGAGSGGAETTVYLATLDANGMIVPIPGAAAVIPSTLTGPRFPAAVFPAVTLPTSGVILQVVMSNNASTTYRASTTVAVGRLAYNTAAGVINGLRGVRAYISGTPPASLSPADLPTTRTALLRVLVKRV
jgi:hypothetical protein